jgi:restriction system protein
MTRNSNGGLEGLGFIAAIPVMIYFESTRPFGLILLGISVVFLTVFFAWSLSKTKKNQRDHSTALASAEGKISDIVGKHIDTLGNRHNTLVRVDRYGVVESDDWNKEIQHFIDKVVRPTLTDSQAQAVASAGINSVFQRLVEDRVVEWCKTRTVSGIVPTDTSPLDFERMCADVLRRHGWNSSTTKGSGDQGADVIAEHSGKKLVVQCKLYAGNVGNKAVQEALAAKYFYSADFAAVVCKSDFTKSAKQLAQSSGIDIVTFDELGAFAERIRLKSGL